MIPHKARRGRFQISSDWLTPRRLGLLMAAPITAIACLLAVSLYDSYQDARKNAELSASNIASALAQDIERLILTVDRTLLVAVDAWRRPDLSVRSPQFRATSAFERSTTSRQLGSVIILDRNGDMVLDSHSAGMPRAGSIADSNSFAIHRDNPESGLLVDGPVKSQPGGEWALILTRRLADANGDFAGVASASIKIGYLREFYRNLDIGAKGSLALISTSGRTVTRLPHIESEIGQPVGNARIIVRAKQAPWGVYRAFSMFDGQDRLIAYKLVGAFPLIQSVAFSWDEIVDDWWNRTLVFIAIFALLCLAIAFLTAVVSSELDRRRLAETELALLARTDALTGLGNRRAFDETIRFEWLRALPPRHTTALLLIDIDHFKLFNDRYGHQAGDFALAKVASAIRRSLSRPADMAARYGGEEFAVILPDSSMQRAARIAQRIHTMLAAIDLPHRASPFDKVTVSVGIAVGNAGTVADDAELLREADAALYRSKRGGRNMICRFPEVDSVSAVEPPHADAA